MKKKTTQHKSLSDMYPKLMTEAIDNLDQTVLNSIVDMIWATYKSGKNIFFAGNGGSASTASHMAADLGKNTSGHTNTHEKRFKTISLCDNPAWVTAVGNDICFDEIFVEQLKCHAGKGDLLIVFSCSGKSANVVKAVKWAKKNSIRSIGFLGFDGGRVKDLLDKSLIVKSFEYGIVESVHSYIHHYIVEVIKQKTIKKVVS